MFRRVPLSIIGS